MNKEDLKRPSLFIVKSLFIEHPLKLQYRIREDFIHRTGLVNDSDACLTLTRVMMHCATDQPYPFIVNLTHLDNKLMGVLSKNGSDLEKIFSTEEILFVKKFADDILNSADFYKIKSKKILKIKSLFAAE